MCQYQWLQRSGGLRIVAGNASGWYFAIYRFQHTFAVGIADAKPVGGRTGKRNDAQSGFYSGVIQAVVLSERDFQKSYGAILLEKSVELS